MPVAPNFSKSNWNLNGRLVVVIQGVLFSFDADLLF